MLNLNVIFSLLKHQNQSCKIIQGLRNFFTVNCRLMTVNFLLHRQTSQLKRWFCQLVHDFWCFIIQ